MMFALTSCSQAAAVPLRSLLEQGKGNAGSVRLNQNAFIVVRTTDAGHLLTLGVAQLNGTVVSGRVNHVGVLANKEYLTPDEREVFNQVAIKVALKCFNLRAEREAAIVAWLERQNASVFRNVSVDFGPMNLQFVRELGDDGQYLTWVRFKRSGVPGMAPWINYCSL